MCRTDAVVTANYQRIARWMAAAVLSVLLVGLASASSALADATIGQATGNHVCAAGFVAADPAYQIPAGGGVITSFSYGNDGANAGAQLDFEVLRPNSDGSYTIAAHTGLQTLAGTNGVETFPSDIPVSGGEVLGYYETGTDNCLYDVTSGTVLAEPFGSDPGVGTTVTASPIADYMLNESATLQTGGATLTAVGSSVSATEGHGFTGQVATFSDTDTQAASAYAATIHWGDGATSSGTVSQTAPGHYAVSASHTYAEAGSYSVAVKISDTDGTSATAAGAATVADASLSASGTGSSTSPVATTTTFTGQLASLTDHNPAGSPSDLTATINWGDGTHSVGTVSGSGGSYTVSGTHSYAANGPYTVRVHIADVGGSTADATSYLVVYGYANQSGGSFVVGDRSGSHVYFWGSHWAGHNRMSRGKGPRSFRGFADSSAQSCGETFGALPSRRSEPPATVPAYMAVAVTDAVSRSHRMLSGTVEKMVVVQTDAGYGPRSHGTGQIVATICG
jgi:hypothetical protein